MSKIKFKTNNTYRSYYAYYIDTCCINLPNLHSSDCKVLAEADIDYTIKLLEGALIINIILLEK